MSVSIRRNTTENLLKPSEFDYISDKNKTFIASFNSEINRLGYTHSNIQGGFCWGKHMLVYTKAGVKSKKSYARIYMRENDIVLRLYFSGIEKHGDFIAKTPQYIKEAFTGEFPKCDHCHGKTECVHQKKYLLEGFEYEICDGKAFWFVNPHLEHLDDYLNLFLEFYPAKNKI